MGANAVDFTWITDFKPYQPQLGVPTMVGGTGQRAAKTQGVLALPLPIDKINKIMTASRQWQAAGMGSGTETYLAGRTVWWSVLGSSARPGGIPETGCGSRHVMMWSAERSSSVGATLLQPVATEGLRAITRQTGTVTSTDYG